MGIVKSSAIARRAVARCVIVASTSAAAAFAQVDLSGTWGAINHEDGLERGAGPYAVDYTALPLNAEGRAKALSYSASQIGEPNASASTATSIIW